ncbi:HAT repeat-containing protein [Capsaspora owczarzaki ATCC 30864]|uniref:HAT repeat-containing protein n=1 Tax=Capsaspora owczarzaki (strain ATCC 30864) TaxID=595528 RepID=A0A0D2X1B4_CAPO3|nr:HAT repeat-containing protein [Capsaspora owczarzaki ATCC 30864]KJE90514.1 HAT repeat-containing protein [Capsaspora owczarzaki ATCC 30864]|eukprot:XP_004364692.1 HAT repeat-containing protein [Capsaspora owczarzaki ATCC 30864]
MADQFGSAPPSGSQQRMPRVAKVKNKAPAALQITAEQIIREAKERQFEVDAKVPHQKIADPAELDAFKGRKRREFEELLKKNRRNTMHWLRYAAFEEQHKEFERARSVFERALDAEPRSIHVFIKYAEFEMSNRFVNHARNIWDRATTLLPRANQLWYKYTYMEEMLGNAAGARQVFERWMAWEPEEQAWNTFIKMELRYGEVANARAIYERFVGVHHDAKNWIKYARFEESQGEIDLARSVFERAVAFFGEEFMDERLFAAFARFEEGQREYDRARVIYKYALERLPKTKAEDLLTSYTQFEKKHGEKRGIEDVILSKRRFQYEEEIQANPSNYDAWFDYIRLEESNGDLERTRDVYERAIANVPPAQEKRLWRRYIYLWIYYALFEELDAKDMDRTREVYRAVIKLIPHKVFTFSKIWLLFARFELRQKNLKAARLVLGNAIGMCPKDQIFRGYIDIELQLREFDNCRKLYEKFLQFNETNSTTWVKFAELEAVLDDVDRARHIFELATSRPSLDMPEVLWKAYIDFETEQGEFDRTRALYRRLLQRTQHVKVWISFAQFEISVPSETNAATARTVFQEADKALRKEHQKEERVLLLEAWKDFESVHGSAETRSEVATKMPMKIKKRKKALAADGSDAGWEEYFDYMFPDEKENAPNVKLLQMAQKWKENQLKLKQQQAPQPPQQQPEPQAASAASSSRAAVPAFQPPAFQDEAESDQAPATAQDDEDDEAELAAFRNSQAALQREREAANADE